MDEFEKIIQEAVPLAEEICLHLMGEPLAHPKFTEVLDLCEKYRAQIQITTNGLLIKKYKSLLLSSSCIRQVNFSLQAFKDNFPHKKLDDYLGPILDFAEQANELKPNMYINYRMWNQKSGDEDKCNDNEDIFRYIEQYFQISINRNIEVGAIKSKRIWNKLYLHFDSRFQWPSLDLPIQGEQGRCNGVLQHIGIHANGVVVPCCLDDQAVINLGNCKDTPLQKILENKRTTDMREGFLNGRLIEDLCKRCTYIKRFQKT